MALGENINKLRLLKGLSRRELSEQLGITEQMLFYVENDKRKPISDWFLKLPDILNCTFNDLFNLNVKLIDNDVIYINKYNMNNLDNTEKVPFNRFILNGLKTDNYNNLRYLKYENDNMAPTILCNDELIIDISDLNVLDNKLYLIEENNRFLLKRLFKTSPFDENITVSNDNKNIDNFPNYQINNRQAKELIKGKLVFYTRNLK